MHGLNDKNTADDLCVTGSVFDIKKFEVHDGPGFRTTVFLKGCPLHCFWCHNPESQHAFPEIFFDSDRCTGCGRCVVACGNGCHSVVNGRHCFDRTKCNGCGKCAEECPNGALELAGRKVTVGEVLSEVLKDRVFYDASGGGMTISGGEPLAQFEFTRALSLMAAREGVLTALDTCGFAPWAEIQALLPVVDWWLYDLKIVEPVLHKKYTGRSNRLILENLRRLDAAGAKIILRRPLIPGVNDSASEERAVEEVVSSLKNEHRLEVNPYHRLGESKYLRLGRRPPRVFSGA